MTLWQFVSGVIRFFILAVYWFGLWIIAHTHIFGPQYFSANVPMYFPVAYQIFAAIIVLISGLLVSERVIRLRLGISFGQPKIEPRKTAVVETEALRLRDMISLLDNDDLDDLRAEVREGLRDRIRNLTADESESFEDLLADAGTKRKRGAR